MTASGGAQTASAGPRSIFRGGSIRRCPHGTGSGGTDQLVSVSAQLARYGVTMPLIVETARRLLPEPDAALLEDNLRGLDAGSRTVAAAAGMAEVADQVRSGILPAAAASDHLRWAAALIALAASGDRADVREMRDRLSTSDADLRGLVPTAICEGFARKWLALHDACGLPTRDEQADRYRS